MDITTQTGPASQIAADWLIVPVWENEALPATAADLDKRLGGMIGKLRERGDVAGKAKELTPIYYNGDLPAGRVLLVGLGQRSKIDLPGLFAAAATAARSLTTKAIRRLAVALPDAVPGLAADAVARAFIAGLMHGCDGPGLKKSKTERYEPESVIVVGPAGASEQAVRRADIEGRAVSLARELVNRPPSDLYPETFAERARQVAAKVKLDCDVMDDHRLRDENMNALLAVAAGSDRPPRVVVLHHRGGGSGPTLGLVGKGVTFDSGGLSLKTTEQMVDMKCDMAGAATVLGAMQAIAELGLPVNVLGVLAMVENMPGGRAMKLGDVLTARNGKTIEVLNTDAEGRLILADALAYAVDHKASHLVDLATLTGACMVALGYDVAGLMTNNEPWGQRVLAAAAGVGERAWPLPMYSFYGDMIKSDVADMKNTGGSRYGGAITAAKLLEEFVAGVPWAHLDIAGPAWAERENATRASGGTGCFVRTLVELASAYGDK